MTEQPIRFLRLQGIAGDWSKHNEHSRNIFSVHGFLRLSVNSSPKGIRGKTGDLCTDPRVSHHTNRESHVFDFCYVI